MRDESPVTLARRGRGRSDSLPTDALSEHPWIDRQGIALVTVVALVLTTSALWIGLRPI
jgi:hypothetical protein